MPDEAQSLGDRQAQPSQRRVLDELALDRIAEAPRWDGTTLVVLVGAPGTRETALLQEAGRRVERDGHRGFQFDLYDCATPIDVGNEICGTIARRTSWILFPRTMRIQRELVKYWPPARPGPTAALIAASEVEFYPDRSSRPLEWVADRAPMGVIRPLAGRWACEELKRLPDEESLSAFDDRYHGLTRLHPEAMALDLAAIARKRRHRHLFLFFDKHERYSATIASRSFEDFLLALTKALGALNANVTIVVARRTQLDPSDLADTSEPWTKDGLRQSDLLRQLKVADSPPQDPSGTGLHARESELLTLAAVPRAFDLEVLSVLTGDTVEREDLGEEIDAGALQPTADSTPERPRWRVEPILRSQILERLAAQPGSKQFREANLRLQKHYEAGPGPHDLDEDFARKLECRYHMASHAPERGLDELFELADCSLREYRVDRCQRIVDALEEIHGLDDADRLRVLLLKVKLFADLEGYDAARELLEAAAAERPSIAQTYNSQAVAIELELAKLERLRGNYRGAIVRYEQVRRMAHGPPPDGVAVAHASWQLAVVHIRRHEIAQAKSELKSAETGYRLLLDLGEKAAETEASRLGIRDVGLKLAHIDRQGADLLRMSGDLVGARSLLRRACDAYEGKDDRALAYARVLLAHILRMDGDPAAAIQEAAAVRDLYERRTLPDRRLRAHAIRAEVLARLADGQAPREDAERLQHIRPDVYPAASTTGWLAIAEIDRRERRWSEASKEYSNALGQAVDHSHGEADYCAALLGLLECSRRGPKNVKAATPGPMGLLDDLLSRPCVEEIPWIGLKAQFERAIWRPIEREAALAAAWESSQRIRRSNGETPHTAFVEWFGAALEEGDDLPTICLELV